MDYDKRRYKESSGKVKVIIMKNQEVAKLLYDIADILEIKGEMTFKVIAYRRAAQTIESMSKDIEDVIAKGEKIPGVGGGIEERIVEYLEGGRSKYLEHIEKGLPPGLVELLKLEGIGPKKVKLFLDHKIKNIKELETAAKAGKLRSISGLGEKTEQNILHSIELSKKRGGRMLLGYAADIAEEIIKELKKTPIEKINVAGSIRRGRETIGDIDILVTSGKPKDVIDFFTKMKFVGDVIAKGSTKASIHLNSGTQVDLRVLPPKEYGSALMYFTGSKEHNVELRRIAIAKRLKLSEYGLIKQSTKGASGSGDKFVAGRNEEEVYKALDMQYIEPEIWENRGEIELAQKRKLPKLIGYGDILGDLQMHTKWSDGVNTVEEMAIAAKDIGYKYICITDHIGKLMIANAMDEKKIEKQRKEIDSVNKKVVGITVLQGGEIDIRADGSLDVKNNVLEKLDIVLASLHSAFKNNGTGRILKTMENPNVDIIAHPSGRLIDKREGADLDLGKIIDKSKETGTILEIDAQPERTDLNDINTKAAIEAGCKLAIDTDAHSAEQLRYMRMGITTARRGWAKKNDIINTQPLEKMLKMLKN